MFATARFRNASIGFHLLVVLKMTILQLLTSVLPVLFPSFLVPSCLLQSRTALSALSEPTAFSDLSRA